MNGLLFYSRDCKYCYSLMKVMEDQGLLNMFRRCCIDEMEDTEIVRYGLETTPTIIIVNNQNGQQLKMKYESKDAFNWVEMVVANRRQNIIRNTENSIKLTQINEMKKRMKDGLYAYCQTEAEGVS